MLEQEAILTRSEALHGHFEGVSFPVFRIALGTAFLSPPNLGQQFAVLDRFAELGGNAIETAQSYGRALGTR